MWLWFFCLSFALNIFLMLYIRWLLKIMESLNDQIKEVSNMILSFNDHLGSVYELEMFYGDDTLKSLMDHSRQLTENLSNLDLILNNTEGDPADEAEEEKT